ncbi:hypothetical protein SGLAM104S_08032 [Streptomyces glaucescens]
MRVEAEGAPAALLPGGRYGGAVGAHPFGERFRQAEFVGGVHAEAAHEQPGRPAQHLGVQPPQLMMLLDLRQLRRQGVPQRLER